MPSKKHTQPAAPQPLGFYLVFFIFLLVASLILRDIDSSFTSFFAAFSTVLSWVGLICTLVLLIRRRNQNAARLVQPLSQPQTLKPAPKPAAIPVETAYEYQVLLDRLQENIVSVKARQTAVEKLIDDYFGQSWISSSRYKQVMQSAEDVLAKNYENAAQAVSLFGRSKPTQARLDILNNYVEDSDDVVANIDRVIDELLKVQQSSTIESGDALDARLEELADTTVYYRQKEESLSQKS